MATGTIVLPVTAADLDLTNPPGVAFSGSGRRKLLFDASADEACTWQVPVPANYSSTLSATIHYSMASATSGNVKLDVYVMAVTGGDSQDMDSDSYDTVNTATAAVPGTAGYPDAEAISLSNNDSCAAGDYMAIKFCRNGSSGSDTASGDLELRLVAVTYTTT